MRSTMRSSAAGLVALAAGTQAVYQGFNYGSTNGDGSARYASDFETYFTTAQNLVGTSGFTSARLYTMIQGGTTADPISAIEAAIKTNTSLLLGLWTSGTGFENELTALKAAIATYGSQLAPLTAGISVGSEDLYRYSADGVAADAGVGKDAGTIVDYISQVREAIAGTALSGASIGHVDTWTAWANSSNSAVIDAVDWIGLDAYPYFQSTMTNPIEDAKTLFDEAIANVNAATGNKELWVTETGWPVSGPTYGQGVASVDNAATFWQTVGCPLFGATNTFWYILQDEGASPSFGVVADASNTTPLYSLTCNTTASSSSSSASGTSSGDIALETDSSSTNSTQSGYNASTSAGAGTVTSPTSTLSTASSKATATGTSSSSSSSSTASTVSTSGAAMKVASAGSAMLALTLAMFAL